MIVEAASFIFRIFKLNTRNRYQTQIPLRLLLITFDYNLEMYQPLILGLELGKRLKEQKSGKDREELMKKGRDKTPRKPSAKAEGEAEGRLGA